MKTLKLSILMFGILAIVSSCKDSDKKIEIDQATIESPDYDMDNTASDASVTEDLVVVDDEYMIYSSDEMEGIYEALDMTKEQINTFETDFNNKIESMTNDTTLTFDKEKLQPEMDKSLKAVLTAEQYTKYEQWKMENPNS